MTNMRRALLILFVLAVGCTDSPEAATAPPRPTYSPALSSASQAVLQQRQQAVQNALQDAKAWGTLGRTYLADKYYEPAAVCFDQVTRIDPTDGPAWMLRGLALEELGDSQAALDAYGHATEAGQSCPAAAWRAALLYLEAGRADAATELAIEAAGRTQGGAMARLVLARSLLDVDRPRDAASVLQKLVAERPSDRYAHLLLGRALQRAGIGGDASHLRLGQGAQPVWHDPWTTAALVHGVSLESRRTIAQAMIDQGLFKKATMLLQKIVLESPKQIGNRVLLAKAMRSAGQLDEALAEMEAVLVEAPDEHPALTQAAGALFTRWQQTGSVADLEQAMAYLDRALVLTESDGQNWILRGEMKRLSGDLEGAASDYRHAAVIYQHKPGLTLQAADLYIQTGGHQEALSLLSGLRGIFPADLNLLLLSAKAHESAGDRDAALRDVGQAAAVAPDDPRVRALMAELAQP